MAVISPAKKWPDRRVPYVAESTEIEAWLLEINTVIGFALLVPRKDDDPDYVLAQKNAYGVSETLGYIKSHGAHKINGKDRFTMQHELFHTLAFHHEQLHAKGPWGAFGTRAKGKANLDGRLMAAWGRNMVPEASRIPAAVAPAKAAVAPAAIGGKAADAAPASRARSSSFSAGEVILSASNEQAIEAHKNAYQAAQDDDNILHFGDCDFDSLMMYSEMRNSAAELRLTMARTGRTAEAPEISNGDVAALQHLYSGSNVLAPAAVASSSSPGAGAVNK